MDLTRCCLPLGRCDIPIVSTTFEAFSDTIGLRYHSLYNGSPGHCHKLGAKTNNKEQNSNTNDLWWCANCWCEDGLPI